MAQYALPLRRVKISTHSKKSINVNRYTLIIPSYRLFSHYQRPRMQGEVLFLGRFTSDLAALSKRKCVRKKNGRRTRPSGIAVVQKWVTSEQKTWSCIHRSVNIKTSQWPCRQILLFTLSTILTACAEQIGSYDLGPTTKANDRSP